MERRKLLKGIGALPIVAGTAAYAKLCGNLQPCPSAATPFQVVLDGPFSVVLHTASPNSDDVTSVTAFTPVEQHSAHLFKLNGVPLDEKKQHHFALNISGFTPPSQPCIARDFNDFCVDHTRFDPAPAGKDIFIAITLPCPTRIITNVTPLAVTIGGTATSHNMPQNHVLEYDISHAGPITMDYREAGHSGSPLGNSFYFEVGLDHPDNDCSHAKDFYNNWMLPFFPDLAGNTIDFPTCPPGAHHQYFFPSRDDRIKLVMLTTTLECKSGGLITTTSP